MFKSASFRYYQIKVNMPRSRSRPQKDKQQSHKHRKQRKQRRRSPSSSQDSSSRSSSNRKHKHRSARSRDRNYKQRHKGSFHQKKKNNYHSRNKQPNKHNKKSQKHSQSSSSSSDSSSNNSSSVSSSTKKRRNTPHFKFKIGEKLGHRYKVTKVLGTGTFGRVLQAKYHDKYYAIKVIKPVQKYIDSARAQKNIVKELNKRDPEDHYHIVRFFQSFYHHQHYCIVFETLGLSLYDLIKKNAHSGYPIRMVQKFTKQIFESIAFMHSLGYTHTDLKPENILLQQQQLRKSNYIKSDNYMLPNNSKIKIIDFGATTHEKERHSSIINTRQYRSPQVILQCCQWNEKSDVWSIGCIIPQLFTGELFFPTHDDIQHLLMIERNASHKIPSWMGKACGNEISQFFDRGQLSESLISRRIKHWQDIIGLKCSNQIFKEEPQLCDLVNLCLQIDPKKRISCAQALQHRFFQMNFSNDY